MISQVFDSAQVLTTHLTLIHSNQFINRFDGQVRKVNQKYKKETTRVKLDKHQKDNKNLEQRK